jgi:hypothetical protein
MNIHHGKQEQAHLNQALELIAFHKGDNLDRARRVSKEGRSIRFATMHLQHLPMRGTDSINVVQSDRNSNLRDIDQENGARRGVHKRRTESDMRRRSEEGTLGRRLSNDSAVSAPGGWKDG